MYTVEVQLPQKWSRMIDLSKYNVSFSMLAFFTEISDAKGTFNT